MNLLSRLFSRRKRQSERFSPGNVVTLHNTGKQMPLALDVDQFCDMILKEEECALLLHLQEYKDAVLKIMQRCGKQKDPCSFPLICQRCYVGLHESPSFISGLTGFRQIGVRIGLQQFTGDVINIGPDRTKAGRARRCFQCGGNKVLLVYSRDKI
jgi:hypothetical protein